MSTSDTSSGSERRRSILGLGSTSCPANTAEVRGRRVDLIIDSGAFRTVIPPTLGAGIPLGDVPDRLQRGAETASGDKLDPLGMRVLECAFLSGPVRSVECLVMDVNRPLVSVSQMATRGWTVTFAPESQGGSFIHHRELGDRHTLWPRDGVYILPAVVVNDPTESTPVPGFPGPASGL